MLKKDAHLKPFSPNESALFMVIHLTPISLCYKKNVMMYKNQPWNPILILLFLMYWLQKGDNTVIISSLVHR